MSLHLPDYLGLETGLGLEQAQMSRKKKKRDKELSLDDIGNVCTLCFKDLELQSSTCDHEKV